MSDPIDQRSPIPVVIYGAKSTQDRHKSIPTQLEQCRQMAAENGWEVLGEYTDEGFSAYSCSRGPGLAAAREQVARAAAERETTAMLIAQHSDRFSRGAGDKPGAPEALIEIWHTERRRNVYLRSVEDDFDLRDSAAVANMGARNFEDSRRKAAATAAGKRRAAVRGDWCGPVPDGYDIERTPDGATIVRRVLMHPERREVYRLLWDMAIDGATVNSIVRELAARGFRTAPRRARPRLFDATRVGKVIVNPFYAGLVVSRGEIIGAGNWPAYVEPDEWRRLRRERSERARHRPEPVGRPRSGLLARLALCECGAIAVQQLAGPRKDGSRRRTYVCRTHMHRRDGCSALPFDADTVERMVLGGLDRLLGEGTAWSDALLAGRAGERARLQTEVAAAAAERDECERAIEKLIDLYDAAALAENENDLELARGALPKRRENMMRAGVRLKAAEDALAGLDDGLEGEGADLAIALLWQSLSGGLAASAGDVKAMNATLRETFDAFELHRDAGELSIVPVLSGEAVARALRDASSPHRVTATLMGDAERGADLLTMLSLTGADTAGANRMAQAVVAEDGTIASHLVHELGEGPAVSVLRDALAELVEQGQLDPRVTIAGAGPTLTDDPDDLEAARAIGVSGPSATTAEASGQSDTQPPSHLPHNTRPGSWRGTAGDSPRRSRTGAPRRALRARW